MRAPPIQPDRQALDFRTLASPVVQNGPADTESALDPYAQLTAAQRAVSVQVAQGLSNPQIALRLCISRYTVQTHIKHIFAKLGLHNRGQLAAMVAYHSTVSGSD